jgi:hypothetical protein
MYQVLGQDFQVTLRAIAEAGNRVLPAFHSGPQQSAGHHHGRSGNSSPIRFDVNGQINSYEYRSVGIILRVTPFITDEGLVEMIVSRISNLADQIPIAVGLSAPSSIPAAIVVVTPNGQTDHRRTHARPEPRPREDSVSGHIPGLGFLFKNKNTAGSNRAFSKVLLTACPAPDPTGRMTSNAKKPPACSSVLSEQELNRFLPMCEKKPAGQKKSRRAKSVGSERQRGTRSAVNHGCRPPELFRSEHSSWASGFGDQRPLFLGRQAIEGTQHRLDRRQLDVGVHTGAHRVRPSPSE